VNTTTGADSPTPRTDAQPKYTIKYVGEMPHEIIDYVTADFARQLERELTEARAEVERQARERRDAEGLLDALHGRIGLFAAKWFFLSDNLPTHETFKQMEDYLARAANMHLELMGERDDLAAELAEYKRGHDYASLINERDTLRAQLAEARAQVSQLAQERDVLRTELEVCESCNCNHRDYIGRLESDRKALRAQVQELKQQLDKP
jgi:chromosome segregation ATPase